MTGLRLLLDSPLNRKYDFRTVYQSRPARGFNLKLIWQMAREIRKHQPALVHIRGLQNEGFHGVLAGRLAGCKSIILSIHGRTGDLISVHPFKRWLFNCIIEPITLRLSHRYYCVCHAQAEAYTSDGAFAGVIHNAVPKHSPIADRQAMRRSLGVGDGNVVGVFTGRLTAEKGLLFLADALNTALVSNSSVFKFVFVGEGPLEGRLRDRLARHCETDQVLFLGPRDDVADILGACDMFVFPTLHENLSNSLLEACAAGLPIIATDVGGNPEVARDGIDSILVAPGRSDSLATAMDRLINDSALRSLLGQAAALRVTTEFSPDATWHRLESLYDAVLQRSSAQ